MTQCHGEDACRSFADGHRIHPIRARLSGDSPWGWRDGTVTSASDGRILLRYLDSEVAVTVEHHRPVPVTPGDPVRLHEQYRVLAACGTWHSVHVLGGLGPVPEPGAPELWAAESLPAVVDLASGDAAPGT